MIHRLYVNDDILKSKADIIVNPVNTVGVMGAGLALQIKNKFPWCLNDYIHACNHGVLKPGGIVTSYNMASDMRIVHLATKQHWRDKSQMLWVINGIKELRKKMNTLNELSDDRIYSVAIPRIGCGLGGLNWDIVYRRIYNNFHDYSGDVFVYE